MSYIHALRAPRLRVLALLAAISVASLAHAAAPKISGTPSSSATVGVTYRFTPSASDADGNKLTFSIANRPGWTSFNTSTGVLTGTPFSNHIGTYSGIVISVSDGSTKVSLPSFSLVVKANANKSPTVSGTPSTTAKVGAAYSFQPTGKDPEGKALTWSIMNKPAWANFNTSTGLLSGTPTATGTFSGIYISASDGVSSTALSTFSIAVSGSTSGTNTAPTITGTPSTTATVGTAYAFTPTAKDANGDTLKFSATNVPSWATFSSSTGKLSGTPTATGKSGTIVISVSDGKSTATLPGFAITVAAASTGGSGTGAATLSWTPPTRNTDGTTLTNLAGYRISYGTSSSSLSSTVTVSNPGISNYVVDNLAKGTWYFSIKSYTSSGNESSASAVVSKSIQ
jgi:Putative Ig domain